MKIRKTRRDRLHQVTGVAVVIDVIKAFTTAAFAFNSGAEEMIVVGPIEEAFRIHASKPHSELIGESSGLPIPGFHHHNSPTEIASKDIRGKTLIMRTSSGTQGVVGCTEATHILAASFVVADATLNRILSLNPPEVTFIITGTKNGDEDEALADYLTERLTGRIVSATPYLERVKNSPHGLHALSNPANLNCSKEDLETTLHIDRFNFAMEVLKEGEHFVMRKS